MRRKYRFYRINNRRRWRQLSNVLERHTVFKSDNTSYTVPFQRKKRVSTFDILAAVLCPVVTFTTSWFSVKNLNGTPMLSILSFVFCLFMFTRVKRNRRENGNGGANLVSIILSVISLVFSGGFAIYLIFLAYKNKGLNYFNMPFHSVTVGETGIMAIVVIGIAVGFYVFIVKKSNEKIKDLANSSIEMTPEEYLRTSRFYGGKTHYIPALSQPGVYILYNKTKNKHYVGQSQNVSRRLNQHFTGHGGNADVYADWKYGDHFTIRVILLTNSGFSSLNELERKAIATYHAYSRGYNKTRGNRG